MVWLGVKACTEKEQVVTGTIDVLADGTVVAAKRVRIVVPPCRFHYSVEVVCGTQETDCDDDREDRDDDGPDRDDRKHDCVTVVPGRYATAVTIYNPGTCPVQIEKRFAPLVLHGKTVGREPEVVQARTFAKLELPGVHATMDDCCALEEAVGDGEGLTFGVLDIISDKPIQVTAVHTAGPEVAHTGGPSIHTRPVEPRRAP